MWYNCQKCHINALSADKLTPKHVEKLLMQSAIGFAVAAILGAIVPHPYNSFSLFAVAIAFLVSGYFSKSAENLSLKYQKTGEKQWV